MRRLLENCIDLYNQGLIQPIHPVTIFDAPHVEAAFRYMQNRQHIGKIVVTIPEDLNDLATEGDSDLVLRSDSSYVLIGGLGGLGRAVSTWMVECGAKHLIFLSRSAGKSKEDERFMTELQIQGCYTQSFAGNVADPLIVENVVKNAARPIAGVIQMSMILKVNSPFFNLKTQLTSLGSRFSSDDPRRLASSHRSKGSRDMEYS